MKKVNKKRRRQIREINSITDCLNGEMRMANLTEDRMDSIRNDIVNIIYAMRAWNQTDENEMKRE